MKPKILIGIDTGVNTGFAVYNREEKRIIVLRTDKIHLVMRHVTDLKSVFPDNIQIRLEDARLRKWIPAAKNEKAERGRASGAGSVKRDAQIWEDYLTDLKIPFELVAPKNNKTKVDANYFKKLTGWQAQTDSHSRDAAMLVYGF